MSVTQEEIRFLCRRYLADLTQSLQPQNLVPDAVLLTPLGRLSALLAAHNYKQAYEDRGRYFGGNEIRRRYEMDLTQSEVCELFRKTIAEIHSNIQPGGYPQIAKRTLGERMDRARELFDLLQDSKHVGAGGEG